MRTLELLKSLNSNSRKEREFTTENLPSFNEKERALAKRILEEDSGTPTIIKGMEMTLFRALELKERIRAKLRLLYLEESFSRFSKEEASLIEMIFGEDTDTGIPVVACDLEMPMGRVLKLKKRTRAKLRKFYQQRNASNKRTSVKGEQTYEKPTLRLVV